MAWMEGRRQKKTSKMIACRNRLVKDPFLIGGAVVTEQIFAWPGIGSLMITAITSRDYPVIMGVAVLICVVVLVVNLILDLIYAALDPRIKFK